MGQNVGFHGRCYLRRCCPARSGPYCWIECPFVLEGWWWYRRFHQGKLYRQYRCPRSRIRQRGPEVERGENQAFGAVDPGALRERSLRCCRSLRSLHHIDTLSLSLSLSLSRVG